MKINKKFTNRRLEPLYELDVGDTFMRCMEGSENYVFIKITPKQDNALCLDTMELVDIWDAERVLPVSSTLTNERE